MTDTPYRGRRKWDPASLPPLQYQAQLIPASVAYNDPAWRRYWTQFDWNVDVVGEQHYQAAIRRAIGAVPFEEGLMWIGQAALVPEPANPHDSNAIRIVINDQLVGYIPRDLAASMAPTLQGRAWPVLAKIEGGFLKNGSKASLGVELAITGHNGAGTNAATKRRTWLARTLEPGTQWECHRCGNEWTTRKRGEPEWWTKKQGPHVCPECKSHYYTAPPL